MAEVKLVGENAPAVPENPPAAAVEVLNAAPLAEPKADELEKEPDEKVLSGAKLAPLVAKVLALAVVLAVVPEAVPTKFELVAVLSGELEYEGDRNGEEDDEEEDEEDDPVIIVVVDCPLVVLFECASCVRVVASAGGGRVTALLKEREIEVEVDD